MLNSSLVEVCTDSIPFLHPFHFNLNFFLCLKTLDSFSNTVLLYRIGFSVIWSFALIYFLTELGEIVATQFSLFHVEFSECKWYLLSIEMQQMLVIVLADGQRPMYIRGYGDISCRRITFKKVIFLTVFFRNKFFFIHHWKINWILMKSCMIFILFLDNSWQLFLLFDTTSIC